MELENRTFLTVIGFIITWLSALFGMGKIYENITSNVKRNSDAIATIKRQMVNDDGDPLLVSYKACDVAKGSCQKVMDGRDTRIVKRLDLNDAKLDKILEMVSRHEERGRNAKTRHDD